MEAPDVERYVEALALALPNFTADEQRAALTLYRQLAMAYPVAHAQLAAELNIPPATTVELLEWPSLETLMHPDAQGRIVGFGGLAVAPMHHKFTVMTACSGPGVRGTACSSPNYSSRPRMSSRATPKRAR